MHPGDYHLVLTTGSTVAYGGHFITSVHLVKTVSCLVHALFTEHYTTNTGHMAFLRIILRFIPCWFRQLSLTKDTDFADLCMCV